MSRAYNGLGIVCGVRGRHPEAQQLFRDSLALAEAGEEQLGIAKALNNLGIMAYFAGDHGAAQRFYQRSLAINQDLGHQYDTEDEIRTKAADLLVTARAHLASDHLPDLSSAPPDSDLWPMVSAMIGAALP